jgi:hypothetical protein
MCPYQSLSVHKRFCRQGPGFVGPCCLVCIARYPRNPAQVRVVAAEHVPRMDLLSASDTFVEASVRTKNKVKTQVGGCMQRPRMTASSQAGLRAHRTACLQVVSNSRHPHWNEAFTLLVHYPEAQILTCTLYDWDQFNANDEIGRWAPRNCAGPAPGAARRLMAFLRHAQGGTAHPGAAPRPAGGRVVRCEAAT